MKKTKQINLTGLFFLLLYIFSIKPFALLHHHSESVAKIAFKTKCEKAIYYNTHDCEHKEHFSKSLDHCFLCYHLSISCHTFFSQSNYLTTIIHTVEPVIFQESNILNCFFTKISDRGPPTV